LSNKIIKLTYEEAYELFVLGKCCSSSSYNPPKISKKMKQLGFKICKVENGHGKFTFLFAQDFLSKFKAIKE